MTTTFETAKIGDRVWCTRNGWGEVESTTNTGNSYPLVVNFREIGTKEVYTLDGWSNYAVVRQSLFWDEIKFEPPVKPVELKVDDKLLVGNTAATQPRHFSHFNENGELFCFTNGSTSHTSGGYVQQWKFWELVE